MGKDPYDLYFNVPSGFRLVTVRCPGARVAATERKGNLATVRLLSPANGKLSWGRLHPLKRRAPTCCRRPTARCGVRDGDHVAAEAILAIWR